MKGKMEREEGGKFGKMKEKKEGRRRRRGGEEGREEGIGERTL